jgi:predicted component of type VI protein secretion system
MRSFIISRLTLSFFPVALQSLKDRGRLTYRRFLELFRHMVGLLGRVISPSRGLYLHRTTQHTKTRTNIHALSGIRTHDPSNQPAKTHASDRTATVTGRLTLCQI